MRRSEGRSNVDGSSATHTVIPALPPVDSGYAWIFLFAATVAEALCFGYNYASGVFLEYWLSELFAGQAEASSILTVATALQTGLLYVTNVPIGQLYSRYPQYRWHIQLASLVFSVTGIVGSAFVRSPGLLLFCSGILYPVGAAAYYYPAITGLYEWWHKRRGLATGIVFAGGGIGGIVWPFVADFLLHRYSYKAAMITMGITYLSLSVPTIYYLKPRNPISRRVRGVEAPRRAFFPKAILKHRLFWTYLATMLLASLGNFIPSIYLPSYASAISLSTTQGTTLVAVMNAASIIGSPAVGWLADIWPTSAVTILSCGIGALSTFLLWGFGQSFGLLTAFAVVFGVFGIGFTSLRSVYTSKAAQEDPVLIPAVSSVFMLIRGIGAVASGIVSNTLLRHHLLLDARFAYGVDNWGSVLIWTGSMLVLACLPTVVVWN